MVRNPIVHNSIQLRIFSKPSSLQRYCCGMTSASKCSAGACAVSLREERWRKRLHYKRVQLIRFGNALGIHYI